MKYRKKPSALAAGVVAMSLLLGANVASAATVTFGSLQGKAIGITELDVGGTIYDVLFDEFATASSIYGPFPGTFPMTGNEANAASIAMVAALNAAEALSVGEDTSVDDPLNSNFSIGVSSGGGTLPLPRLCFSRKAISLEASGANHALITRAMLAKIAPGPPSHHPNP